MSPAADAAPSDEIVIREARDTDVPGISEIFRAVYGDDYPYQQFYDAEWLKASVYNDDVLMFVAEDRDGTLIGTSSIVCEQGATSDLLGEFGRLAVHPKGRRRGLGRRLMKARLENVENRLHVAYVEARCVHPFAQKISLEHGFAAVGFLPRKHLFLERECVAVLVHYFAGALKLRRNHPRIVPEAYPLAAAALGNVGLDFDAIVDETSPAYPLDGEFVADTMSEDGLAVLLRMERGRVTHREIFGPLRLQYGFFQIKAKSADYLVARHEGRVAGAAGFIHDTVEKTLRIFELVTPHDEAIRFLLTELERRAREEWDVDYIEVDVSAHAPRMQRTLVELGFMPVAYIPAMVFADVERLDVVKMARLTGDTAIGEVHLTAPVDRIRSIVMRAFERRQVQPKLVGFVAKLGLFEGLQGEQVQRLASFCTPQVFADGALLIEEGAKSGRMMILLSGRGIVTVGDPAKRLGGVGPGEVIGELSALTRSPHSATVRAEGPVEAAVLDTSELESLSRRRPDIAVVVYRNLAKALGRKLRRANITMSMLNHTDSDLI